MLAIPNIYMPQPFLIMPRGVEINKKGDTLVSKFYTCLLFVHDIQSNDPCLALRNFNVLAYIYTAQKFYNAVASLSLHSSPEDP